MSLLIHLHSQIPLLRFQSTKLATGETKKTSSLMSWVLFLALTRDDRLGIC